MLSSLADYVKVDVTFRPSKAVSTQRVHVTAAGFDWELLLDGSKFYDTRARIGGGGAIDLVVHLWQVPFKRAVAMLHAAGL